MLRRRPIASAVTPALGEPKILATLRRPESRDETALLKWVSALLEQGRDIEGNSDAALRYVMLQLALEGATEAGSPAHAAAALGELGRFAVDDALLRYQTAIDLASGPRQPPADELLGLLVEAGYGVLDKDLKRARRTLIETDIQRQHYDAAAISTTTLESLRTLRSDIAEAERRRPAEHGRQQVPDTDARAVAKAAIEDRVQRHDLLAQSQRLTVARELLRDGLEFAKHDDAMRFELLEAAIRMAEADRDTALVRHATDGLAIQFEIGDSADRLLASAKRIDTAGGCAMRPMVRLYLDVVERSIPARLDLAAAAVVAAQRLLAERIVSHSDREELAGQCEALADEVEFLTESRDLRAALAEDPADKKAAHRLGWLLCVRTGQWQEGLPLLVTGKVYPVWLVAQQDLAAPSELSDILEVAKGWVEVTAEKGVTANERIVLQQRARAFFERARSLASGLDAIEIDNYLKLLEPADPATRSASSRKKKPADESPLAMALEWLARHQDEDGKWDTDEFCKHDTHGEPCDGPGNPIQDVGITALAVLAFMEAGSTPTKGERQGEVAAGLRWLARQQEAPNGLFGSDNSHDFVYGHAIATLAMVRGYANSRETQWRRSAERGLAYLESHRNPYSVWRYQPRDNDNDTSVTAWCLTAYGDAKAAGLKVDPAAFKCGEAWLDQVSLPTGQHGYTSRREPSSSRHPGDHASRFPPEHNPTLTAVGLWSRMRLGQSPKRAIVRAAADLVAGTPPQWERVKIDYYYWYYGTIALKAVGGRHWQDWRRALRAAVIDHQRSEGNERGSWDPVGVWCEDGGRVYATALMCIVLAAADL